MHVNVSTKLATPTKIDRACAPVRDHFAVLISRCTYLKVTIICRYMFLQIELKLCYARTKICDFVHGIGTGTTISNALYCQ